MRQSNINKQSCSAHLLLILLLLLIYSPFYATTTSFSHSKIVKTLPGFPGDLPFKLHTGYIGVGKGEEVQLFYYFIESEHDPKSDPLMLWLTGGPGCTVLSAIFFEHIGPLSFNYTGIDFNYTTSTWETHLPALQLNPYSWTKFANIIFVDSPIGTGFSYATTTESYSTVIDIVVSQQLYEFVQKWLMKHPQFATNPFYVGASSYSGMIAPIVAQEIVDGSEDELGTKINIKGYVLGSPLTDPYSLYRQGKIDFIHRVSILSDELYEQSKVSCGGPYWNISSVECDLNIGSILPLISSLYDDHVLEPTCKGSNPRYMCRENSRSIFNIWINNAQVQEALHVREGTVGHVDKCNRTLQTFRSYSTRIFSSLGYHQYLSNKPLRALIYSGDQEMTVPYVGVPRWIKELNVQISNDWRPWFVSDQVAGYITEYSNGLYNLTSITMKGSGHCASEWKPRESCAMFERWLASNPI